jgi:hypothetical protein
MTSEGREINKAKFYAGFYLRTRRRMRFWGWGNPTPKTAERPWMEVADWLRMAHSFTKPDTLAQYDKPTPVLPEEKDRPAQPAKRGFHFVCNKSFVGLVIR